MRIGILGGTFDPIHYGHLLLAEQCREQCELDEIWLLPAKLPPHKTRQAISGETARAEMAEFAVAGMPEYEVNRLEYGREGKSFTVETLSELQAEDSTRELFFLIGADSLHALPTWREPTRIAELATIVAVNRGDRPLPSPDELIERLGATVANRVRLVTMPGVDISSTDIRARVKSGQSIRFQLPRAVEAYIEQHGLYRGE